METIIYNRIYLKADVLLDIRTYVQCVFVFIYIKADIFNICSAIVGRCTVFIFCNAALVVLQVQSRVSIFISWITGA